MSERVAGYCPMGCGETLFVGAGGFVTCSNLPCPRPDAVSDLLGDRETEHVVKLGERVFTVRHPLRERLDDALMTCDLHEWIECRAGPPAATGRYRVVWRGEPSTARWVSV
jgi:hypothetical protein